MVKVSQRLQAPKTWLGSESVNVLQVLCDLLELVEQINNHVAGHVHASSPPPNNAATFINAGVAAGDLTRKLKPIIL
ncbi:hypothetical protein D3C77_719560 [compost metagenome]